MQVADYLWLSSSRGRGPIGPNPTREERMAYRASFCTHNDRRGRPVFDVFYPSLPPDERREWLEDKAALGLTHIVLCRKYGYPRYTDWMKKQFGVTWEGRDVPQDEFQALLREVLDAGFFPIVWLPFDEDQAGMNAIYDGRMEAELLALVPLAHRLGGVVPAWETPGAWRSKANIDASLLMRRILGPAAVLVLHGRDNERFTGASWPVEADDPAHGDEAGWWRLTEYDVFFWESRHGADGPSYSDGDPDPDSETWLGRFLEGFERFAPDGTYMPALGRYVREPDIHGRRAPDWFHGSKIRPLCVPFELQEYEDVTDQVPDARIAYTANQLESYGVTAFGSGIPDSMRP